MRTSKFILSLIIVLAVVILFNQWQIISLYGTMKKGITVSDDGAGSAQTAQAAAAKLLPKGVPPLYGEELGISFDNAAAAISVLAPYEQDTRADKLTGELLDRYIKIGSSIACEFCCGAKTMVFADGSKACGCAHSAAMRGVAAYLLDNYGDQLSDEEILAEVAKWKAVFFPGSTVQKYLSQQGAGGASAAGLQQQVGGC
jgi:hypothetical protein